MGSLIGLGAVGVTLSYSILRFANFAHVQLAVVGAYAVYAAEGMNTDVRINVVGTRDGGNTWTLPLVAVFGTRAISVLEEALSTDASAPLNVTMLSAGTGLKPRPFSVIAAPGPPAGGCGRRG